PFGVAIRSFPLRTAVPLCFPEARSGPTMRERLICAAPVEAAAAGVVRAPTGRRVVPIARARAVTRTPRVTPTTVDDRERAWIGPVDAAEPTSQVEFVTQPAHGDQIDGGTGVGLELRAQPLHVHVEGLGVADVVGAPDPVDELTAGEHATRIA